MNFTPYIARPIRYAGITDVAGYRLKRYVILYGGGPLREPEFAAGMRLAHESLPQPGIDLQRPGVGFAIAHQGNGVDYLVLAWWDNQNELPLRVFVRPQTPTGEWRPARGGESVCVWDLEVIGFERNAYVKTLLNAGTAEHYLELHLG